MNRSWQQTSSGLLPWSFMVYLHSNSAMLKNILLSNSNKTCAVIEDDNAVKGTDLFRAVLKHDIENDSVKEIHLVACENPPEYYLGAASNSKVVVYNVFQDPNCWLEKNELSCDEILDRVLSQKEFLSSLMIDSFHFFGEEFFFAKIHKLKFHFKKVICLLHRDMITCRETINKLTFISNAYLKLNRNKAMVSAHMDDKRKSLIEGIYKKPSGKIATFQEISTIDDNFHLHTEVYKEVDHNVCPSSIKDDLKNITTFRLGLDIRENEKIARDNLILPYLRSSEGGSKAECEEGKIVYYAESGDDLEEDPDDDLDI